MTAKEEENMNKKSYEAHYISTLVGNLLLL